MEDMLTDHEVARNISMNVRLFLAKQGLRQAELARRTGETPTTIGHICAGRMGADGHRKLVVPGVGVVSRIAAVLDVSVDQLVTHPPTNAEELIDRYDAGDGRKKRYLKVTA